MAKRLICVIISVLMIVSLLPMGAFATDVDEAPASASSEEQTVAETDETDENVEESEVEETETVTLGASLTTGSSVFPSGGALESATYEMTGNETLDSITVDSDVTATIDLKGYTLSAPITVNGGTLTITDTTATENVAKSGGTVSGDITVSSGKLTISAGYYTGTLSGVEHGAEIEFGTFSSKITAAETVIGYADSGYYYSYQNSDSSYTYTNSVRNESVTVNGETTYYTGFDAALTAANDANKTATLTVLDNSGFTGTTSISIVDGISVVGDLTINFNNCNISTSVTTDYIFNVSSEASLKLLSNPNSLIGSSSATSKENGGIAVYVDGGTLTLGDSCYLAGYYGVYVTNGGTVNVSGSYPEIRASNTGIYVESGSVVLSGTGEIFAGTYGVYLASSSCLFTLSGSGYIDSDNYGVYSNGGTVSVTGSGTISGDNYGVYSVGGSVSMTGAGTISGTAIGSVGVYISGNSTLTISTGSISGNLYGIQTVNSTVTLNSPFSSIFGYTTGIYADASTVTITGLDSSSEISSNNACVSANNGSTVTIDSGWFTGSCLYADSDSSIAVSGGLYYFDVSDYCVSGYEVAEDEGGYIIVESSGTYTATNTITGAKYATLQAAIDAASSGDSITLLASVTEDITIASDDVITLDLAGYTITGTGSTSVITVNGTLTLTDSTATSSTSASGTVGTTLNSDGTYTTVYTETTYNSETDSLTTTYHSYTSGAITGGKGSNYYTSNQIGGGIYVTDSGSLTMNGGTVYGNSLAPSSYSPYGAGIAVDQGSLTITGGVVAGNSMTPASGKASNGAGVYVAIGSFTMTGGAICNNTVTASSSCGGGLYLVNGNKTSTEYTISGGVISGNTARAGAGIYVSNSTLTFSGAIVSDNSIVTSGIGGGICLVLGSKMTMTGGTIANNTALASTSSCYGGGVCLKTDDSSVEFTMSGGVIAGNTAYTGGGVYIGSPDSGTNQFTMTGGTITGNVASGASGNGGGVYVAYYADFTMSGGSITENTAKVSGGGVYVYNDSYASVTMTGGTISDNTAGTNGGGAFVEYNAVFTLGGSATITGNTVSSSNNNVYLDDSVIVLSSTLTGTVGVKTYTAPTESSTVQVTKAETSTTYYASSYGNFVSDDGYITSANSENAYVVLTVGAYLGISDSTTKVPVSEVPSDGDSVMYVLVSAGNITANYTTTSYPTTTATCGTDVTYVFAGWYSYDDENGYVALTSVPTTDAYAKFVDANVLTVKAQISSGTTASSSYTNMRFVSSVDDLYFSEVGFYITIGTKTVTVSSTTVYEKIYGADDTYTPSSVFSSVSSYFYAYTLKTIPSGVFDSDITVVAYWKTTDGTIVSGKSSTFVISGMYDTTGTSE